MAKYISTDVKGEVDIRMGTEGPAALPPTTVVASFESVVKRHGDKTALRVQRDGAWKEYSWQEYFNQCKRFGNSLISLGMNKNQAVNVIGFNSPEWFMANCGAILAGGVVAGIYTTNGSEACKFITEHSEAAVVVCDGLAQLAKYTGIAGELKGLKALVVYNAEAPTDVKCSVPVYGFEDFLKLGDQVEESKLRQRMDDQKPGHCCTLIYTSGTTGNPKGVMISHDNITWTANSVTEAVNGLTTADRIVSYLPLSHVAAQMLDIHAPMVDGCCISFAQPDALKGSLGTTLKDVRPTVFFGVPRVWEKIAEKMWAIGKKTTGIKKTLATWAKSKGAAKNELAQFGKSGGAPCGYGLANSIILSKVQAALGLDQCRIAFTGAAPIGMEVLQYFASLDIPILELFGQSECTGPQTMNFPNKWKMGSAGVAIGGTTMKINPETQELSYSGRNLMMGYLKGEQQTKDTFDDAGYLLSGDCAKIDSDGFMSITGRIKELIITAGGENVPPVIIEDKIKEQTKALSNCMVVGDKRKFLSVLLCLRVNMNEDGSPSQNLDPQALEVAKEIGSSATTVSEAKSCDAFKTYFDSKIAAANKQATSRAQNIAKWALLDEDFTVNGGELTPTLKLKRRIVSDKCSEVIEKIYA